MMHLQKTTLLKGLDNPQFCDRVLKKKRSQNAQPKNEVLRSKGAWGHCPQQAVCGEMDSHKHCLPQYAAHKMKN